MRHYCKPWCWGQSFDVNSMIEQVLDSDFSDLNSTTSEIITSQSVIRIFFIITPLFIFLENLSVSWKCNYCICWSIWIVISVKTRNIDIIVVPLFFHFSTLLIIVSWNIWEWSFDKDEVYLFGISFEMEIVLDFVLGLSKFLFNLQSVV